MPNSWFPWCCCGGVPCLPCGQHKFAKLEKNLRVTFAGLPTSTWLFSGRCWKLSDPLPDREYFYSRGILNDTPSTVTYETPWTWLEPSVPPNLAINPCRTVDPQTGQLAAGISPYVSLGTFSEDWFEYPTDPTYGGNCVNPNYKGFCEVYANPIVTINTTLPGSVWCGTGKNFWVDFFLQMYVRMKRKDNGQCAPIPGAGPLFYASEIAGSRVPVTGAEFFDGVPLQKRVSISHSEPNAVGTLVSVPYGEGTWTCQLV